VVFEFAQLAPSMSRAPGGIGYTDWVDMCAQFTQSYGLSMDQSAVVTWPFQGSGHWGEPALRLPMISGIDSALYSFVLAQTGSELQQDDVRLANSGQYLYVLAQGMTNGMGVVSTAPQTMTETQRLANAAFSVADQAADAVGLPSLQGVEDFLKGVGRDLAVGVGVTVLVAYILRKK
jgi:hypothetical protein